MQHPLYKIAQEIRKDWGSKINFAAKPYLDAMLTLNSIKDNYYLDSAETIVIYFLSNAATWRGETAKRIKAELKAMCKLGDNIMLDDLEITTRLYLDQAQIIVMRWVINRAVKALMSHADNLEALALIRGTFKESDGGFLTLQHAKIILNIILEEKY